MCDLDQLERTLLKRAEEYDGFDNMEGQLIAEAKVHGANDEEAAALAQQVMKRLQVQTEGTPAKGNQFGKSWDTGKIAKRIGEMRY